MNVNVSSKLTKKYMINQLIKKVFNITLNYNIKKQKYINQPENRDINQWINLINIYYIIYTKNKY